MKEDEATFHYSRWWCICHAGVILCLLDFSPVGVCHAEQVAHANRLYTFDTVDNGGTTTPTTPVQFDAALTGQTLVQGAEGKALQLRIARSMAPPHRSSG